MLSKFLDPKNDIAFKKIFGEEASKNHLVSFLNSVFNLEEKKKIVKVDFLNPYQAPRIEGKKISYIDVLVTDQRNIRYVVEMQMYRVLGFEKRAQYYAAKTYVSQNESGDKYPQLNKVYFVAIANHVMFPDKAEYKSDHLILDNKTYQHDLQDISFTFIELPKFTKPLEECVTVEDKWLHFLKHAPEEEEIPSLIQEESIISAYKTLNRYGWSDSEIQAYDDANLSLADLYAGHELSYVEGRAEGRIEGRTDALRAIVANMKRQGCSNAQICAITGLSDEDVNYAL